MSRFLFCVFITTSLVYFAGGCVPNIKGPIRALQNLYKDLPCLQCNAFDIADPLHCLENHTINGNATCGFVISSFFLSPEHCAVTSLSCVPKVGDNFAFWGISGNDSKITIIFEANKVSTALQLICNNQSVWQISNSSSPFLPLNKTNSTTTKRFELPAEFVSGNFTLHCLSSKDFFNAEQDEPLALPVAESNDEKKEQLKETNKTVNVDQNAKTIASFTPSKSESNAQSQPVPEESAVISNTTVEADTVNVTKTSTELQTVNVTETVDINESETFNQTETASDSKSVNVTATVAASKPETVNGTETSAVNELE